MADCTPQALAAAASCLRCIPKRRPVRTYLLCQWANKPTCDPDALAFIAAAGIDNQTEIDAICALVSDLKNTVPATTPGLSFWNRELVIYPMVGYRLVNPVARMGVNLKTPGTFNFVNGPNAPTYSALGIKGNGVNQNVFTNFTPSLNGGAILTQNSARAMWYVDQDSTDAAYQMYWGGQNGGVPNNALRAASPISPPATANFVYDVNAAASDRTAANGASSTGIKFIQRNNDAANVQGAFGSNSWVTRANNSTGLCAVNMPLLCLSTSGGLSFFSDCRLSGFSLGAPLSDAERAQYKTIWDKFQHALGRDHP